MGSLQIPKLKTKSPNTINMASTSSQYHILSWVSHLFCRVSFVPISFCTMKWSPQDAMKAYLHTLQLSKIQYGQDCTLGPTKVIQPQCMEFLSALAAGNQAKVMVQVLSNEGVNPLTIALAVAAKHCGSRFICFLDQQQDIEDCKAQLSCYDLEDVVEFMDGNPCEVITQLKNIDFSVIDCKFKDHLRLFQIIDMNPRGSIVVVCNLVRKGNGAGFGEVIRGKRGVECVTLSIGEGMELTRIGVTRNHENKGLHATSEN